MPIYVVGHRNPDTDSICSAIGYAAFKEQLGQAHYVAARSGEVGAEAAFLLARFGIAAPILLGNVRTKVADVMRPNIVSVAPGTSLKEAYRLLRLHRAKLAVVVRDGGGLAGIITDADLAVAFMGSFGSVRPRLKVRARNLADVLEGEMVCGSPDCPVNGDVYVAAMSPESMTRLVQPGAVIITGDRPDVQLLSARIASCLIVTGSSPVGPEVVEIASGRGVPVVVVPGDTYAVSRMVGLAGPVEGVMNNEPVVFAPEDLLGDVVKQTREARHRVYPVVDEEGRQVVGLLYRDDLFNAPGQSLVLVDHNETSQSVKGIEEARILEVVDHHRLGDVQTREPIFVRNEPVGSTATIVAKMADEAGVVLPPSICGLLLGAVLSDTLVFRSPTCTETDRRVAAKLAASCGENPEELGMEMLRAGSDVEGMPAERLVRRNLKEYVLAGSRVAIGQCEAVDIARLLDRSGEILAEMNKLCEERQLGVVVMMLTEILRQGTHILVAGPERALIASAFGEKGGKGGFYLPGVLSRKMQVLPRVTQALGG